MSDQGRAYPDYSSGTPGERVSWELEQRIETLPRRQRQILQLVNGGTMTFREVAEIMGIKPDSARQLFYKACRNLWDRPEGLRLEPLDRIPPDVREIERLRREKGLTVREASQELGLKFNTVKQRLRRARVRYRADEKYASWGMPPASEAQLRNKTQGARRSLPSSSSDSRRPSSGGASEAPAERKTAPSEGSATTSAGIGPRREAVVPSHGTGGAGLEPAPPGPREGTLSAKESDENNEPKQ